MLLCLAGFSARQFKKYMLLCFKHDVTAFYNKSHITTTHCLLYFLKLQASPVSITTTQINVFYMYIKCFILELCDVNYMSGAQRGKNENSVTFLRYEQNFSRCANFAHALYIVFIVKSKFINIKHCISLADIVYLTHVQK